MDDFPHSILTETAHRPWPMPAAPWVMTQTWHDLLFAHWPIPADTLRRLVPADFPIDEYDGTGWIGVVPFRMTNVAPRLVPALPWISAFPELNVRTYVRVDDKPGVYFFSLDAARTLAVLSAWTLLNLPYYSASMTVTRDGDDVRYVSRRTRTPAAFVARYRSSSHPQPPQPGTLEYFLTERYCLYALDHRRRPYRLDIHHPRWPLQRAEAEIETNTMAQAAGVALPDAAPLLHFAARQDMVAWLPQRLR